jgi:hypothetical protein
MAATESQIEDFAEELGKLLGNARAKAEGWLGQRQQITKALQGIRDEATSLLSQFGESTQAIAGRVRRGRTTGSRNISKRGPGRPKGSGRKKKRTMSPEARAAIGAAQKARWAKLKAAGKKK